MDLTQRIAALEAAVFGGLPVWSSARTISLAGPVSITPLTGLLVILSAPGPVQVSLPLPSALQNGFVLCFLDANGQANSIETPPGGIVSGTVFESMVIDGGEVGNYATLVAENGVWAFGGGRPGYTTPWSMSGPS
ncbi:MAG TPA: hypothetical protein VK302_10610 [Terriglobales bacterium]|nr:hypothetical protein [Terriglobales bacterium]